MFIQANAKATVYRSTDELQKGAQVAAGIYGFFDAGGSGGVTSGGVRLNQRDLALQEQAFAKFTAQYNAGYERNMIVDIESLNFGTVNTYRILNIESYSHPALPPFAVLTLEQRYN